LVNIDFKIGLVNSKKAKKSVFEKKNQIIFTRFFETQLLFG
jgi:hypothetical protein